MRALAASLCLMLLASCGFEPVYQQQADGIDTRDILARIAIQTPGGREGDHFKATLQDRFYQSLQPADPRYQLNINFNIQSQPFIIDQDGISSRFALTLRSNYELRRISDNKRLHRGSLSRKVSYNVSQDADYATFISERDARERGLKLLAEDYATRISSVISQAEQN